MKLIVLIFAAGVALAQTTRYPGAIDADSSLFIVADNVQTTLNAAMAIGDTTAVVSSSTGFVPNMIATICDTTTNTGKCTAWEHMLVTAVAGNVLTLTRAFAGTTARTHSSGRLVSVLIDSAHQKVLKDSVVAIETALGPNLSNVASSPMKNSASYIFSPYSCNSSSVCVPGGPSGMSLIAGNNTLTMTPVPPGVNGSDKNHPLYVSGGTGAANACLITGGSGVAGQPSGTIIVNCANTHSGAWTIQSATAGIQEAISAAGPAGQVTVPGGTYTTYATITLTGGDGATAGPFLSGPSATINAVGAGYPIVTLGTPTAGLGHAFIQLGALVGQGAGGTIDALLAANFAQSTIQVGQIANVRHGVHVLTAAGNAVADNRFKLFVVQAVYNGIYFDDASASGNNEEGNWWDAVIFGASNYSMINHVTGPGHSTDDLNFFLGTYDGGGLGDINDNTASFFLTDYIGIVTRISPSSVSLGVSGFTPQQLRGPLAITSGTGDVMFKFGSAAGQQHIELGSANTDTAGQIAITAANSGSRPFTNGWNSTPTCVVSPVTDPGPGLRWWVTSTNSLVGISLSAAATVTFNYFCVGHPN